jgi:hypothetical protein
MNHQGNKSVKWKNHASNVSEDKGRLSRNAIATALLISSIITIFGSLVGYELLVGHKADISTPLQEALKSFAFGIGLLMLVIAIATKAQLNETDDAPNAYAGAIDDEPGHQADEPASLDEIDKLLLSQDPYFALQLAHALHQKAKYFTIRVQDIEDMRAILDDREEQRHQTPCPQATHLAKLIKVLEQNNAR